MDTSEWRQSLEQVFPRLSGEPFEIVAPASIQYNCIAYAAGDASSWWDTVKEDSYWPDYATRTRRMESLIEVFTGLEFQRCRNSSLESGFEKVALYDEQGLWTHAALQTPTGRWRSKMGKGPLIEHISPESLSDGIYGSPTVYMRRSANRSAISG
ncbi:MAG: hypothetical protein OXP09_14195 [Gammaproteobacteria bacterium]|nr:hypothetical protein [Gammaproteobacteria bacterium]